MTYRPAQLPGSVLPSPSSPVLYNPVLSKPASSWLAANADRERAVDVLRAGFAEGRLTQDEFNERVAQVYASRTYGELADLTADLPAGPLPVEMGPVGMGPVGMGPPGLMPAAYSGPPMRRPASALVSPASLAGLALTAIIVFALAALLTGAAVYVHMHGAVHVPYSRPYGGHAHLLPSITRLH